MIEEHEGVKPLPPTVEQIRDRRKAAGLIQAEAGKLLYTNQRVWSQWETGKRQMHPVFWELFCIKTAALVRNHGRKPTNGRPANPVAR